MLTAITVSIVFITCHSQLNPNKPPGKNFDLSHFKLTLPDKDASTIYEAQLEAGYESQYFYTDKTDGSMTFWTPSSGGTTKGSSYPRSELRHNCNVSSDHINWGIANGTYSITATYKIDTNHTAEKTVFQQIHAFNQEPLCKIQFELDNDGKTGNVYSFYQLTDSGKDEKKVLLGEVGFDKFDFETKIEDSHLKLYLNGAQKLNVDVSYWAQYGNYFKAGDYLQSNTGDQYDIVHIYALKVVLDGPCTYYD